MKYLFPGNSMLLFQLLFAAIVRLGPEKYAIKKVDRLAQPIIITNTTSQEKRSFESIYKAAKFLNIDGACIRMKKKGKNPLTNRHLCVGENHYLLEFAED